MVKPLQSVDFVVRPYGDSNPGYRLRRPRWYPDYIIRANSAGENLHYQHYSGLAHLWHRTGFLTVERFHSYPQCLQDHDFTFTESRYSSLFSWSIGESDIATPGAISSTASCSSFEWFKTPLACSNSWARVCFSKSGSSISLGSVSYTHLTLPTTPYV